MHTTAIPFAVQLPAEVPFAFPLTQLARVPSTLVDRRARRGVRYPLAPLLTIAVVAKLAGQSRLEPLADWAPRRAPELARVFGLKRLSMPHQTTWSRILAKAVDVNALEGILAPFFQAMQRQASVPARGSLWLSTARPCAVRFRLVLCRVCI